MAVQRPRNVRFAPFGAGACLLIGLFAALVLVSGSAGVSRGADPRDAMPPAAPRAGPLDPDYGDPFYPNYADAVAQLQALATGYPTIASLRVIGREEHGTRNIVALKISDNVSLEEDEPTWVFTGIIHGNEQMGLHILLSLAEELVTDYGPLSPVTNWVDAYEIWVVAVLNPWGYDHDVAGTSVYTGTRKNGANTGSTNTSGVDLARNYDLGWSLGDCGSTSANDGEFIGSSAFSERETRAIRDLYLQQRPLFGITFHHGNDPDGGQIMRPWGDDNIAAWIVPDAVQIEEVATRYRDWVFDSRSIGAFCGSTPLTDPDGDGHCTTSTDREFCDELCWTPAMGRLGRCGQPSNWYYHELGTIDLTVETSDRPFNGEFMHSLSGPGNDYEQDIQDIAYEFAFNHWEAIKAWLDYFLVSYYQPFEFTGPGLTGHITDLVLGTPLAATVEVSGYTSSQIEDRTSDQAFGRYWRLLPAATHHVTVSKPGYATWEGDVVVGTGAFTTLDVALTPTLQIVLPNSTSVAWVGAPEAPGTFTVRVRLGSGGTACEGPLPFMVWVRDATDNLIPAFTGAQACVQDTYWISVQAPSSLDGSFVSGGIYDLRVDLDTVTGESTAAVRYDDREEDTILVMDVSGSMGSSGKIDAARQAASLLVHELSANDQGALVWFSGNGTEPGHDAGTDFRLTPMAEVSQSLLITDILGLALKNMTSIGDGLTEALDESESVRADPDHACGLVLLSDGVENEAAYWTDVQTRTAASPCAVHVVALGPEADEVLLHQIGQKGTPGTSDDGSYMYAAISDTLAATAGVQAAGAEWPNRLAGIYDDIASRLARRQRFFRVLGRADDTPDDYAFEIDTTTVQAVVALNWSGVASTVQLALYDPDGNLMKPETPGVIYRSTPTHQVYRITAPEAGKWQATVTNIEPGAPVQPYILTASGLTSVEFRVFTGADVAPVHQGESVDILGVLTTQGQPITGAIVRVTVDAPGGVQNTLRLFDDGRHADGMANDGVYANTYGRTIAGDVINPKLPEGGGLQVVGSYRLEATAQTGDGQRMASAGFSVIPSPDTDKDGMPDPWEIANGLDPKNDDDVEDDPDLDGLNNLGEFQAGTDPQNSDTEGGGESDGSEVDFGRDPLWRFDDTIAAIDGAAAAPLPKGARITWTPYASHSDYGLWRRKLGDDAWTMVNSKIPPTGTYDDGGLTNGNTYEYMLVARGAAGQRSGTSPVLTVTPVADPFPPEGQVTINGGAQVTPIRRVELGFQADADTKELRLGSALDEGTDEIGGGWREMQTRLDWRIPVEIGDGTLWTVYTQFRDDAGNESTVVSDTIRYQPGCYDFYPPAGVTMGDIQYAASRWRSSSPGAADYDGDGNEDIVDIMLVAGKWGQTCP